MPSQHAPKRKAAKTTDTDADDIQIISVKKLKASPTADSTEAATNAPFKLLVKLDPKFKVFPLDLQSLLQEAYKQTLYTYQAALRQKTLQKSPDTKYKLVAGERARSETLIFTSNVIQHNVLDKNMANAFLMEHLLGIPGLMAEKRGFVQTDTNNNVANPAFLRLHLARQGEIAWGFDADGCLSFYCARVERNSLVERVWYVVRDEVKIEVEE